jgi:hypothetical protein
VPADMVRSSAGVVQGSAQDWRTQAGRVARHGVSAL